jgi:myosin heavy subunit
MNDTQEFADVCHSMGVMNIPADTQWKIWQLVSAILHIGNVQFTDDGKGTAQSDQQTLEVPSLVQGFSSFVSDFFFFFAF